ncbi:hypothetical protein [Blastococcus sp. TF02A-26]|uniref:hypothetical protein n=1 Tax=Blastococcus sp. TF02A-26 TaxID=2250577 RepID=UPI0011BEC47A|nr:hypothetical protein [Blastococcus sp. TF02A-26]
MTGPDKVDTGNDALLPAPHQSVLAGPTKATRLGGWLPWALGGGGALLGMAVGAVIAVAALDPTTSDEYRDLEGRMAAEQSQASEAQRATEDEARSAVESAEASASAAAASASQYADELAQRDAEVSAREQAVAVVEQRIAATSIGQGTWTVGRDIEPGTYRTAQAVTGDCYWGIYRTGSNGDDIIENDIVTGGFPTVTLSVGQDFENNRCGTFIKE